MTALASQLPTFRRYFRAAFNLGVRIFRAVFTWRRVRRALLGVAILVTLIVAFYMEELWRGQRAWEAARRDFEAQGGVLDLAKLAPPPVPDDQNFAMTPLLQPLYLQGSPDQPIRYYKELWAKLVWPAAKGKNPDATEPILFKSWQENKPVDLNAWREFFGQSDILEALKKFDPVLSEITLASRRPVALFPFEYEKGADTWRNSVDPFSQMMKIHELLQQLTNIYEVRALAELAAGQTDRAADDAVTIFQLACFVNNEPGMFSQFMSSWHAAGGMQILWEGLAAHRWSDAQLIRFSDELQKIDFLAGELRGEQWYIARRGDQFETVADTSRLYGLFQGGRDNLFDGQTDGTISLLLQILKYHLRSWLHHQEAYWFPHGWLYQNQIVSLQDSQKILALFDIPHHRLDPVKDKALDDEFAHRKTTPFNFIANNLNYTDEWAGLGRIFGSSQAWMDEAQVACALERYRLANGQLPETLAELAPKFIAKIPTDIISGGPLHYQKKADGHFLLYEVGWNGTDDGGVIAKDDNDELDLKNGDWVWPDAAQP